MVDKWTNPTTANLRGENSMPLQQTFSSLSTYLGKLDDAITAAAASGVSSIAAGAGISVSAGTGAVTVANTGVTSVAGTANQVTVSAATGGITFSLPSTVSFPGRVNIASEKLWFGAGTRQMINLWSSNDSAPQYGIGVQSNTQYFRSGAYFAWYAGGVHDDTALSAGTGGTRIMYTDSANDLNLVNRVIAYGFMGNGNVGGTGTAAWFPSGLYSGTSGQAWIYGEKHFGYGNIEASGYHWNNGATGLNDANSISCTNWFRSTGGSGWYNATYQGGIWMSDSTWIRVYNNKNFYCSQELRANRYSGDGNAYYGSYGSISVVGTKNGYSGMDNSDTSSCMMMRNDLLGHYRNNNTWNFYVQYGTFYTSDERYKRNFAPLTLGLNFIKKLKTFEFNRLTERPDDDAEALMPRIYYGFSAQQVKSALEEVGELRENCVWSVGGPDDDGATGGDRQYVSLEGLVPSVVKAIQEIDDRLSRMEQMLYEQSNPS